MEEGLLVSGSEDGRVVGWKDMGELVLDEKVSDEVVTCVATDKGRLACSDSGGALRLLEVNQR